MTSGEAATCLVGNDEPLREAEENENDEEELLKQAIAMSLEECCHKLQGKFSSVHPELSQEGIIRVEVGKEGLHFIPGTGAFFEIFL